ncbi:hypothetical protein [Kerstersia gyiorum]|jgi:hypothetical protein|uniref:hypothetical protein n=1 Tax=Kerstersia gyiorum TaxID=206506 RepID=UPI00242C1FB8|nr:hypothetical protein [Kerstersia gyiorum]MCH4270373.1 hypothetical protein [Kerstersia gyiorum]MCI1228883.1 hypothetical protein [Kerstersia gyiorum]
MFTLKQVFVGISLATAVGAVHAQSIGSVTSNDTFLRAGATTSTGFHGPVGAPGIGLGAGETWVISLQSISLPFTKQDTFNGFTRYQLKDYSHATTDPLPETKNYNFNWVQVPTASNGALKVYFGLVTKKDTTNVTQAFETGDRTGFAAPAGGTSYNAAGLLVVGAVDGSSPTKLTGTLNLNGAATALSGSLVDAAAAHTLAINANNVNASAGTLAGTASYNGGPSTHAVNGHFYGAGANSALAGTVNGGSTFQAAFGGIAQ